MCVKTDDRFTDGFFLESVILDDSSKQHCDMLNPQTAEHLTHTRIHKIHLTTQVINSIFNYIIHNKKDTTCRLIQCLTSLKKVCVNERVYKYDLTPVKVNK